jgi:hypothetical protein
MRTLGKLAMDFRTLGALASTALGALALLVSPAHAQTKVGTTMAQFLKIEPSARIIAMGNAGVSLPGGIDAAWYNPAALASEEAITVLFSHGEWFADIGHDYVAGAFPMGRWGISSLTVTSLRSGDMDVRTVTQPLGTGERFSVASLAVGLGYALPITDRFSAGGRISYVQETIWNSAFQTVTFDFGTLYSVSDRGLRLGASLTNFGTQGRYDGRDLHFLYDNDPDINGDNSSLPGERFTDAFSLPVMFRVGVGYPVRLSQASILTLAADAFHPSDNAESMSLGAEYEFRDFVALRAGYQNLFLVDSEVGVTAGGGLHGDLSEYTYRIDYAWADHGRLGGTHRFSLGFEF